MMTLAVLRPEPGNAATAARAEAAGYAVLRLPLFAVVPLGWTRPDPRDHDALVLTSANTVRMAGALGGVAALPAIAVGAQTAITARAAGLTVIATGSSDAAALGAVLAAHGIGRALHLGGRDRAAVPYGVARSIAVYASEPLPVAAADLAALGGAVALLHSARAAARLGALVDAAGIQRSDITLAAFSAAIAVTAGSGWKAIAVAAEPVDTALFAAIGALVR